MNTPSPTLPTRTEAETRAAMQMRERASELCNQLGDAEFALRANKQNVGIATLAQRHYIKCAAEILELPLFDGDGK